MPQLSSSWVRFLRLLKDKLAATTLHYVIEVFELQLIVSSLEVRLF